MQARAYPEEYCGLVSRTQSTQKGFHSYPFSYQFSLFALNVLFTIGPLLDRSGFQETAVMLTFFTSIFAMAGHGLAGLWTQQVWLLFLYTSPALLAGLYLGDKINLMIPKQLFNRIIYAMLIITGLLFFI